MNVDQTHGMFQMCLRISMCTCVRTHVVYMHVSAVNILPWATLYKNQGPNLSFQVQTHVCTERQCREYTFLLSIAMDTMFDKPFRTEGQPLKATMGSRARLTKMYGNLLSKLNMDTC